MSELPVELICLMADQLIDEAHRVRGTCKKEIRVTLASMLFITKFLTDYLKNKNTELNMLFPKKTVVNTLRYPGKSKRQIMAITRTLPNGNRHGKQVMYECKNSTFEPHDTKNICQFRDGVLLRIIFRGRMHHTVTYSIIDHENKFSISLKYDKYICGKTGPQTLKVESEKLWTVFLSNTVPYTLYNNLDKKYEEIAHAVETILVCEFENVKKINIQHLRKKISALLKNYCCG